MDKTNEIYINYNQNVPKCDNNLEHDYLEIRNSRDVNRSGLHKKVCNRCRLVVVWDDSD